MLSGSGITTSKAESAQNIGLMYRALSGENFLMPSRAISSISPALSEGSIFITFVDLTSL